MLGGLMVAVSVCDFTISCNGASIGVLRDGSVADLTTDFGMNSVLSNTWNFGNKMLD